MHREEFLCVLICANGAIETIPNEKVLASIGDHIDNPIPDPPTPKLAATVMLVRDSKPGQTKYRIDNGVFPPISRTTRTSKCSCCVV